MKHVATLFKVTLGFAFCVVLAGSCAAALYGVRAVPVLTGSMQPHYGIGSLALTKPVDTKSLRVGQVVAFRPPTPFTTPKNAPIMHRIVSVEPDTDGALAVKTKGDNNPTADVWVLKFTEPTTHVTFVDVPYVGHVASALTNSHGAVRVVAIAGVGLLALALMIWPTTQPTPRKIKAGGREVDLSETWPLVASAPHELRTALTQVKAAIELMQETDDIVARQELLAVAGRGSDRLDQTVEKLLFASGLESWNEESAVGVNDIVAAVTSERQLGSPDIALLPYKGRGHVKGNPDAIARAVRSMIDHVQYMTGCQDNVAIEVGGCGSRVTVQVHSPHHSLDLAGRSGTWRNESSLNLALIQRVAADHSGWVEHGATEQGVTVEISLPKIAPSGGFKGWFKRILYSPKYRARSISTS